MIIGIVSLTIGGAIQMSRIQERKQAVREIAGQRPSGIIEAIAARAIGDLTKELLNPSDGSTADGTLDHLLKTSSPIFSEAHPRIYGKGEFQIDVKDTTGIKVVAGVSGTVLTQAEAAQKSSEGGLFIAPESDPQVWLETSATECNYRMTIKVQVCQAMVAGRTKFRFDITDPGLNVPWTPGCPKTDSNLVTYRTYLNISSPVFATTAVVKCGVQEDPNKEKDFTFFVLHSQSDIVPTCPLGYDSMWSGYSLTSLAMDNNASAPQSLSSTGSCLEVGSGMPFIYCDVDKCKYGDIHNGSARSMWLANQNTSGSQVTSDLTKDEQAQTSVNMTSRCTVCAGSAPLITKHSFSTVPPPCPPGWKLQWQGYTFMGGVEDFNKYMSQDLGSPGSCLRQFVPTATLRCKEKECKYADGSDYYLWAVASESVGDNSSVNNKSNNVYSTTPNIPRIGRCAVCSKEF